MNQLVDPTNVKWLRWRFECTAEDNRPIIFPPPGPWWETGIGHDHTTIVAYLPEGVPVTDYWPEVTSDRISFVDPCPEGITFTDRFPAPEWWLELQRSPQPASSNRYA